MITLSARQAPSPRARDMRRVAGESRLFTAALALFVVLVFALSPFALTALGIPYADAGGNALAKFHPATFYICGLALLVALAKGDPLAAVLGAARENPAAVAMAVAIVVGCLHAMLLSRLPVSPLIDTFLPAALTLVLLRKMPERRGRMLALLLHALMFANAGLALSEFLSGWRLTPFVLDGEELTYEWRSSALLGHPLANAVLTGCYILILAFGGGRDLPGPLRVAAFLFSLAVMAAFGGRAATVFALLLLAALAGKILLGVLRGGRINSTTVIVGLAGLPVLGSGLLWLISTGFLARFFDRFAYDSGSAQARSDMIEIFAHVPIGDLVLGPDPRQVETWQGLLGLERGVESFWLSLVLFYGLLVTAVIVAALLLHCREIVRRSRPGAALVLIYFIAVSSLSVSLAGKSGILTIVTLMLLVLMRPQPTSPR